MSNFFDNLSGQGFPQQVTAVAFRWYEAVGVGDPTQPGAMAPFLQDNNGALLVGILGPNGGILLPDDADTVAETAADERVPTVARLYALNGDTQDAFDRLRNDDEELESRGASPTSLPLRVQTQERLFINNGDFYERKKGQGVYDIAPSAARSATTTFGNFLNVNWRAIHVIVNVTAIGADSLTITINGRVAFPPFNFYPLLTSAAITTTGVTVLKIGIGFTPVSNLTANDMVPYITNVVATHSGADPITYSIAANASV